MNTVDATLSTAGVKRSEQGRALGVAAVVHSRMVLLKDLKVMPWLLVSASVATAWVVVVVSRRRYVMLLASADNDNCRRYQECEAKAVAAQRECERLQSECDQLEAALSHSMRQLAKHAADAERREEEVAEQRVAEEMQKLMSSLEEAHAALEYDSTGQAARHEARRKSLEQARAVRLAAENARPNEAEKRIDVLHARLVELRSAAAGEEEATSQQRPTANGDVPLRITSKEARRSQQAQNSARLRAKIAERKATISELEAKLGAPGTRRTQADASPDAASGTPAGP